MRSKPIPEISNSTLSADANTVDSVDQRRLTSLLGYRITRSELQVRRLFQECVRGFDLKPVDYSLLVLVDANPAIHQRQLGEVLNVSPPNLAIVVARLVKRRLLRQVRGRQDRRMQHLHLTASGSGLLAQAEVEVVRMEQQLVSALGMNQARALLRALDRLEAL